MGHKILFVLIFLSSSFAFGKKIRDNDAFLNLINRMIEAPRWRKSKRAYHYEKFFNQIANCEPPCTLAFDGFFGDISVKKNKQLVLNIEVLRTQGNVGSGYRATTQDLGQHFANLNSAMLEGAVTLLRNQPEYQSFMIRGLSIHNKKLAQLLKRSGFKHKLTPTVIVTQIFLGLNILIIGQSICEAFITKQWSFALGSLGSNGLLGVVLPLLIGLSKGNFQFVIPRQAIQQL